MFSIVRLRNVLYSLTAASALAFSPAAMSADHAESPAADAFPDADIADVFVFQSPDRPATSVGVITWRGRPAPRSRIDDFNCDTSVLFTYNIDRADATGAFDNIPDVSIYARLGTNPDGKCAVQFENVPGAGGTFVVPFEAITTSPSGMRGFLSLRNDPFFFDVEGFNAMISTFATAGQHGDLIGSFRLTDPAARHDSFAFRNISVMMFEMKNDVLAPKVNGVHPKVRIWATTGKLAS